MKRLVKKSKSKSYWQNKADKQLQEIGRMTYKKCLICGGEYSCLHHFVKKSQSTYLRYNLKNCIPICNNCHCSIHQGKNDIKTGQIVIIKGEEWFKEIERLRKQGIGMNFGKRYYEEMYNKLKLLTPYKPYENKFSRR